MYQANCIYKPGAADELEVKPGDELEHLNRDPNGWVKVRQKVSGCQGWVPLACLKVRICREFVLPICMILTGVKHPRFVVRDRETI